MPKNSYWKGASPTKFFTIIIVLIAFLLAIAALATFNGTFWTIGGALLTSLISPPLLSIKFFWPKHKTTAKIVMLFAFILLNIFIVFYFVSLCTSYPMYSLALIEYFVALILILSVFVLLYERYLILKLESKRALTE